MSRPRLSPRWLFHNSPAVWIGTSTMEITSAEPKDVSVDPDGNWRATLTISPTAVPGDYVLHSDCQQSRQIEATYPDVPISVAAAS